jgi:hypothetical protein
MNQLVVHHIYANGAACDFPGYRNHGLPFDATDTPAPDAPGFTYASEDSRVSVPPGNSLQDLLPVRAVVSFNLNPEGGLTRSCYLIEGRAGFGLAVEPEGSLQGMILDAAGNWTGAQSPARVVSTGTWHATHLSFKGELHHEHNCPRPSDLLTYPSRGTGQRGSGFSLIGTTGWVRSL